MATRFEASPLQHHGDQILADVVQVAFDCSDGYLPRGLDLGFHQTGLEEFQTRLHGAGGDQHLRHEKVAVLEAPADFVHGGDQRLVENGMRGDARFESSFDPRFRLWGLSINHVLEDCFQVHVISSSDDSSWYRSIKVALRQMRSGPVNYFAPQAGMIKYGILDCKYPNRQT